MNMQFDGIAEFVAVAQLGSFTAAADQLGITKSAVGRAVSRLEARLGAKLLHRTTRRLTLTSQGEAWLENSMAALAQLDRGESILKLSQNTPAGQVRIDLPTAFGRLFVMPVLLELVSRCPAILLKVSFSDGQADLISEGIDLAVRIGAIDDTAHLIARRLGAQQLVICAAPDYLAERGTPLNPADLAEHDCIVGWQLSRHATWLLKQSDGSFAPQLFRPSTSFATWRWCWPLSRRDEALRSCRFGWFKMTFRAENSSRYLTVCLAEKCPSPCCGREPERYPQRSA